MSTTAGEWSAVLTRAVSTVTALVAAVVVGVAPAAPAAPAPQVAVPVPRRPAHTLVVVMENHDYAAVVGKRTAPWLNGLPAAVMTNWHGVTHPSQPNYLALFTGSTHGVRDDRCPVTVTGPSLAGQLAGAGLTFVGYSEDLPRAGSTVCRSRGYVRKHNPWVDVAGLPTTVNQPSTALPRDYSRLPTVAFLVPNLCHDTHDCSVATGDAWLRRTLSGYVAWARTHDSLLVVTYDEDDGSRRNHVPTVFVGPMVVPGRYGVWGDHYTLLRTVEGLYGLPGIGTAGRRTPVAGIWR